MNNKLLQAHGGCGIVNRYASGIERIKILLEARRLKSYLMADSDLSIFYKIADGTLSPLEGPMAADEFYSVLDNEYIIRNDKKYAWTIPIAFAIDSSDASAVKKGETIAIRDSKNRVIGILEVSDIYKFDKDKYNNIVYGTTRRDHPGPRIVNNDKRDYLLGGRIKAISKPCYSGYNKYMLTPREIRKIFTKRNWQRIIAFQTRNPLHRAHEYALVYALEYFVKKGIFAGAVLNPLVGAVKEDDVPAPVRMKTYEVLISQKLLGKGDRDDNFWKGQKQGLFERILLVGLDMKMFYAGPKEAVMHAIYRQNNGFSDIIIGRKHADAPFDDGTPVWGDFDAQYKFNTLKGELLIKPFNVGSAAYLEELGRVVITEDYKDRNYHQLSIAGQDLRKILENGDPVDERLMRRPVAEILRKYYKEKKDNGQ